MHYFTRFSFSKHFEGRYGLNVCVPKCICGTPNPQCDGIRKCLGQEGGALVKGISALIKGPQRAPSGLPPCGGTVRRRHL